MFALPLKKKFPINSKRQAISAVAYSKKGVKDRTLSAKERDIVLRKVHSKYPSINITPVRKARKTTGKWLGLPSPSKAFDGSRRRKQKNNNRDDYRITRQVAWQADQDSGTRQREQDRRERQGERDRSRSDYRRSGYDNGSY